MLDGARGAGEFHQSATARRLDDAAAVLGDFGFDEFPVVLAPNGTAGTGEHMIIQIANSGNQNSHRCWGLSPTWQAQPKGLPVVCFGACGDGSHLARVVLRLMQSGRAQSCVRPLDAGLTTAGSGGRTTESRYPISPFNSNPLRHSTLAEHLRLGFVWGWIGPGCGNIWPQARAEESGWPPRARCRHDDKLAEPPRHPLPQWPRCFSLRQLAAAPRATLRRRK